MKTSKITKKTLKSLVITSVDGFGRNFRIDTSSEEDIKFVLIATRQSLKNEVKIYFNGESKNAYMNNSASKKQFVDCVYNTIS